MPNPSRRLDDPWRWSQREREVQAAEVLNTAANAADLWRREGNPKEATAYRALYEQSIDHYIEIEFHRRLWDAHRASPDLPVAEVRYRVAKGLELEYPWIHPSDSLKEAHKCWAIQAAASAMQHNALVKASPRDR